MQRLYEGMFLLDAGRASANFDDAINHVKGILDRSGASLVVAKRWDERKLAYEVDGHKRGAYLLTFFRADPEKLTGLERDCQLSDVVLRSIVIRRDKMTEEQANATKTVAEIKEEEARKERERAAVEAARTRDEGAAAAAAAAAPTETFEVPRELAEEFR